MFGRQWFALGSQAGLSRIAIQFEHALRNRRLRLARNLLIENFDSLPARYWNRMWSRLKWLDKYHKSKRKELRYYFYGFWPDMDIVDCQIIDLFRAASSAPIWRPAENPREADIVFSSCYTVDYEDIKRESQQALQVLFLGENIRPYFTDYDLSISFDQPAYNGRNIYLPLWMLEIDWFNKPLYKDRKTVSLSRLTEKRMLDLSGRQNAICFIGNNYEPFRAFALEKLEELGIIVDKYGSQTKPVSDKHSLLQKYKYTLCFENSYFPGYTTEKPVHSYLAGCRSLYWGGLDPIIEADANNSLIRIESADDIEEIGHRIASSDFYSDIMEQGPFVKLDQINKRMDSTLSSIRTILGQFMPSLNDP